MEYSLEKNILKYYFYRIFTKRVFLPLIVIFLIDIGEASLEQIALIASITAIVQFVMEIPSGYIADRWGHKQSIAFGSFISAVSVLPYIFFPGFLGGLIASCLFFGGYAFVSGTIQAFIHETLLSLERDHEYSVIMGRAQSFGLLGNIILVSLVPLTYVIHPKLPFILGFLCLFIAFLIVLSFKSPPKRLPIKEEGYRKGTLEKLRQIASKVPIARFSIVFLLFGIVSSGFDHAVMFREAIFRDAGIPVFWFGFFLAFGSLLAAIGGFYIHHLKKLSPSFFYLFDTAYLVVACLLVSITRSPLLLVGIFALFPAYDRTRNIIFESQVFEEFPYSKYKATIVSLMNFVALLNSIWVPILLGSLVGKFGFQDGYMQFSILIGTLLAVILIVQKILQSKTPPVFR